MRYPNTGNDIKLYYHGHLIKTTFPKFRVGKIILMFLKAVPPKPHLFDQKYMVILKKKKKMNL